MKETSYSALRLLITTIICLFIAELLVMLALSFFEQEKLSIFTISIIDSSLLILISIPILYVFMFRPLITQIEEKKKSEIKSSALKREQVVNKLLHLSLENISLQEIFRLFLQNITGLSWLSILEKGAVFLIEEDPDLLVMKANIGLQDQLLTQCAKVPLGNCLCGKTASSGKTLFVNCIDDRHDIRPEGMLPHGHYCVPIISVDKKVLGVFTLYTEEQAPHDESTEAMLVAAASMLASIITRKQVEEEKEKLICKLQDALGEIQTLQGIVPICCECKKIRDDNGYWEQVENYIEKHSKAEFSHSFCPDCAEKDLKRLEAHIAKKKERRTLYKVEY